MNQIKTQTRPFTLYTGDPYTKQFVLRELNKVYAALKKSPEEISGWTPTATLATGTGRDAPGR